MSGTCDLKNCLHRANSTVRCVFHFLGRKWHVSGTNKVKHISGSRMTGMQGLGLNRVSQKWVQRYVDIASVVSLAMYDVVWNVGFYAPSLGLHVLKLISRLIDLLAVGLSPSESGYQSENVATFNASTMVLAFSAAKCRYSTWTSVREKNHWPTILAQELRNRDFGLIDFDN